MTARASGRQQVHVGLCVPSQHCVRPPSQPHTPWWCEQHPRRSTSGLDAASDARGAVKANSKASDPMTLRARRMDSSPECDLQAYRGSTRASRCDGTAGCETGPDTREGVEAALDRLCEALKDDAEGLAVAVLPVRRGGSSPPEAA